MTKIFKKVTHSRSIVHPTNPNLDSWDVTTDWVEIAEEDIRPGDIIVRAEVAP